MDNIIGLKIISMKKFESFLMISGFICSGFSLFLNLSSGPSAWMWQFSSMCWIAVAFMKERTIRILDRSSDEKP